MMKTQRLQPNLFIRMSGSLSEVLVYTGGWR